MKHPANVLTGKKTNQRVRIKPGLALMPDPILTMHFVLHFPIIDLRPIQEDSGKLPCPTWPMPDVEKGFIRNFGQVQDRMTGGHYFWASEDKFCSAEKAITIQNKITRRQKYNLLELYKRFYSDGLFMNKIEVSFAEPFTSLRESKKTISLGDELLKYCFLPTSIIHSEKNSQQKLYTCGPLLAKAYGISSTFAEKTSQDYSKLLLAGEPLLIASYNTNLPVNLPSKSKLVFHNINQYREKERISLHYVRLKHWSHKIKTWMIGIPDRRYAEETAMVIRDLRINLSRIHTEKETIRLLLNSINSRLISLDKNSKAAETIEWYLKKISEKLFRTVRYNIPQSNILDLALKSEHKITFGSSRTLQDQISLFRDNFLGKNIKQLVNFYNMGTINNINGNNNQVFNNSTLTNSLNTIEKNHGKELSEALNALEEYVKKTKDEKAMSAVADLTKEIEKKSPKKNIVISIWNGLIQLLPPLKDITTIAMNINKLFDSSEKK